MKSQDVSNELSSHFHSVHGGWYEEGIRVQLIKLVAKVKVELFCLPTGASAVIVRVMTC